jgi:biopolymer transport protein ExbB
MPSAFGLSHVWHQGDWVTRTVVIVLLAMSVVSWIVIAIKAANLRRHRAQARGCDGFWHSADFAGGLATLESATRGAQDNPFRALAIEGRDSTNHILHLDGGAPGQLHDSLDVSDWVTRSLRNAIDDFTARLQSGLGILASVGATAPFVGLFGTVWGIYHALIGIGESGSATIDKVAGPIGEALIMTALGLAVAIPAVLGYNALVRGNKGVLHKLNRFAHDLHAYFVTGARVADDGLRRAMSPARPPAKATA